MLNSTLSSTQDVSTLSTKQETIAYTDGACSGNPGAGGWAGIILFPNQQILELGGRSPHTTNNQMEMMAVLKVLQATQTHKTKLRILSDSKYVIQGITSWIHGWKKKGWKKSDGSPLLNKELWQELYHEVYDLNRSQNIEWIHVRGHQGIAGNERADQIAVSFAQNLPLDLFEGHSKDYDFDLETEIVSSPEKKTAPLSKKPSAQDFTLYLSYWGGVLETHNSWESCKQRVQGKSYPKYKKCKNQEEIRQTLAQWGLPLDSV